MIVIISSGGSSISIKINISVRVTIIILCRATVKPTWPNSARPAILNVRCVWSSCLSPRVYIRPEGCSSVCTILNFFSFKLQILFSSLGISDRLLLIFAHPARIFKKLSQGGPASSVSWYIDDWVKGAGEENEKGSHEREPDARDSVLLVTAPNGE